MTMLVAYMTNSFFINMYKETSHYNIRIELFQHKSAIVCVSLNLISSTFHYTLVYIKLSQTPRSPQFFFPKNKLLRIRYTLRQNNSCFHYLVQLLDSSGCFISVLKAIQYCIDNPLRNITRKRHYTLKENVKTSSCPIFSTTLSNGAFYCIQIHVSIFENYYDENITTLRLWVLVVQIYLPFLV